MKRLILAVAVAAGVLGVVPAFAFMNEVALLRQELEIYQSSHPTDLSDFVDRLAVIDDTNFSDVSQSDWFYEAVTSLRQWGIVDGKKGRDGKLTGAFGPQETVTVAAALKVAMKAAQVDTSQCPSVPTHASVQSHWAASFVACGEQMGMRVLKVKKIQLDAEVTRGQVLGIIHDAFGQTVKPQKAPFRDTAKDPYEADIGLAVQEGVVSADAAKGTGRFRPKASVTRAEISVLLFRQLGARAKQELQQAGGKKIGV